MMQQEDSADFNNKQLEQLRKPLLEVSKWTRFIASLGFGIGTFLVVSMLLAGNMIMKSYLNALPVKFEGMYTLLIVSFFIVFFVAAAVLYFLYRGALNIRSGVQHNNTTLIAEGFNNLKKFFVVAAIFFGLNIFITLLKILS